QLVGGLFEEGRKARAGDFLLAFKQHRHLDRQFAGDFLPCATSFDEGEQLTLVVGCATGNDMRVAVGLLDEGRLERIGVPQFQRVGGLDVVMAVEQHMRTGAAAVVADHHRVTLGRTHRGVEAEAGQFVGEPFGGALAIFGMSRVGRDRRNADQVAQTRDAVVQSGVDFSQNLVEIVVHETHLCWASRRTISALNSLAIWSASRRTFLRSSVSTSRSRISHWPSTMTSRTSVAIVAKTSIE